MSPPVNRVRYFERRFAANERADFNWTVCSAEHLRGFRLQGEYRLALLLSLTMDGVEMLAHCDGVPLELLQSGSLDWFDCVRYPTWEPGRVLTLKIWNTSYDPAIIRVRPIVRGDERDWPEAKRVTS